MMRKASEDEKIQFIKELDIYGYAKLENFIPKDVIDDLLQKVEDCYSATKSTGYRGIPDRDKDDKIVYNLQNKHKVFIDILSDEFVKEVCARKLNDPYYRFLPKEVGNYILSYYNARSSGRKLDLHIDSYIPAFGDRTWSIQIVFVLQKMSVANGCTVVVPGSHKSGSYTDREIANVKPLEANAGALIAWDSRLWHGTTANTVKQSRWALIATFTSWWIKQSMDMTRSLPDNIYQQLSDDQKVMLGFCAIPPKDEADRINTKTGYESLQLSVDDYWKTRK